MTKTELPMLRTSERQAFKRCRQRHQWGSVEGLRSPRSKPALEFGTIIHDCMQVFYQPGRKRGPRPATTFKKLIKEHGDFKMAEYDEHDNKTARDASELGLAMMEAYYEEYGDDEDIAIIAPEMPFRTRLTDAGGKPFWYVGRFDALGIWIPTDTPFIFEHKTGSEQLKSMLWGDEQTSSYWAFAPGYIRALQRADMLRKFKGTLELEMMLFNFMAKRMPDDRPMNSEGLRLNKNGTVSKRQPKEQFERIEAHRDEDDRKSVIKRIKQEMYEIRLVREGKLPVYKNFTKDCSWDCAFRDMCELHETRSDWRSFRNQMYEASDGYLEYAQDLGMKSPMDFMEIGSGVK